MEIHVFANEPRRQAVLIAKFDNLGKGASGAAVQNLELMLGFAAAREAPDPPRERFDERAREKGRSRRRKQRGRDRGGVVGREIGRAAVLERRPIVGQGDEE